MHTCAHMKKHTHTCTHTHTHTLSLSLFVFLSERFVIMSYILCCQHFSTLIYQHFYIRPPYLLD